MIDTTRVVAIHAEEQARDAQLGVNAVKRTVSRMRWWWGAGVLVGAIFAGGYALRDREDHFARRAEVNDLSEKVNALSVENKLILQRVGTLIEMVAEVREDQRSERAARRERGSRGQ